MGRYALGLPCWEPELISALVASNEYYTIWNAHIKEMINEQRQDHNNTAYEFYVTEDLITLMKIFLY
jgi:hypothetical protein